MMIEIRRIVCPTDFSDFSRHALRSAIGLARRYHAPITALHVLPLSGTDELADGTGPITPDQLFLRDLSDFVEPARAAGIPTETRMLRGNAAKQILECAGSKPGDVLVMGTHGRGGFQRWILGSVTETVLRRARCPVLTVPAKADCEEPDGPGRFRRILCPVDFSASSAAAVDYAFAIAQNSSDGQVTLLHVIDGLSAEQIEAYVHMNVKDFERVLAQEARADIEGFVAGRAPAATKMELLVATGRAHEEIQRTADAHGSDLIVMGIHGRGPLDLMLFGSTTHHVLRGARCPVLTIRAHHKRERA